MAGIQQDVLNKLYDWQGVERCDALNAQDFGWRAQMDTSAVTAMDAFVGGFRMREWKPTPDNNAAATGVTHAKPGYQYCYLYDNSNQVADLRDRTLSSCDTLKQRLGNPEVLVRTFTDKGSDKSHSLPYQKCVLEIDQSKMSVASLNDFWKRAGENECAEMYSRSAQNLGNVKHTYSACNELHRYYRHAAPAYDACVTQCNSLVRGLVASASLYTSSNCAFYGVPPPTEEECPAELAAPSWVGTSNDLATTLKGMQSAHAQSNLALKAAQSDLKTTVARLGALQRREQEMHALKQSIEDDLSRCSNLDVPSAIQEIELLKQREVDGKANVAQITKMMAECRNSLSSAQARWTSLSNHNAGVKRHNDQMEYELHMCRVDIEELQERTKTHKGDVAKFGSLYSACEAEVATLIARNKSMEKRVADLVVERDEWLRRCSYNQANWHQDNVKVIADYAEQGRGIGNSLCGSSDPLAGEIAQMIRTRAALEAAMVMLNAPCTSMFAETCCK